MLRQKGETSMRIARRALLAAPLAAPARAEAPWPTRPVRFIVPFAAGSPVEIPARFIAEHLSPRLGQPVIVESRAGAGGAIGIQAVAQARDGHSLLFTTSALAILPALMRDPGFDPIQDFAPVTMVSDAPMAVLAKPGSTIRDLDDLLARAKAAPGAITYGSSGAGSTTHLGGALLAARAGVELLHIPYRGAAPAANALHAGDIELMVTGMGEAMPHIRGGRIRALAVTGPSRIPELPEVPAAAERVPGYAMSIWYALLAPRGMPAEVVARLAGLVAPLREGSALAERMRGSGVTLLLDGPGPLEARLAREVPEWKRIAAAANIRAE